MPRALQVRSDPPQSGGSGWWACKKQASSATRDACQPPAYSVPCARSLAVWH